MTANSYKCLCFLDFTGRFCETKQNIDSGLSFSTLNQHIYNHNPSKDYLPGKIEMPLPKCTTIGCLNNLLEEIVKNLNLLLNHQKVGEYSNEAIEI